MGIPYLESGENSTSPHVHNHFKTCSIFVHEFLTIFYGQMSTISEKPLQHRLDKGMIAGQPWLFNHTARIDYLGTGFQLEIWENGD